MKRFLMSVLLVVWSGCIVADPLPQQAHVYVEGSAEIEAEPDLMNFSLSIELVDLDLAKAKASVDERSRQLIALCKKMGISAKDIATTALNIRPQYEYRNQERVLVGNSVSRQVDISLRDLKKYPEFMQALVTAKISETINTELTLADKKSLEEKAQIAAMEDARARAARLVKSQGKKLGDVWSISEFNLRNNERWQLIPNRKLEGSSAAMDEISGFSGVARMKTASEPFEPGVMKFAAQVYVVYLLQ